METSQSTGASFRSGQVGSTLGDWCVTGQLHKMQKKTFFQVQT